VKTLNQIETKYRIALKSLKTSLKDFKGKNVIIPFGYFEGRKGKITGMVLNSDGEILACCQPYRIKGEGPDLLWNHKDARTYWQIKDKDLV